MIEIFGKDNCIWSDKSKELLDSRHMSYKYYTLGVDYGIDFIIETFPGVKTVPIILINGFRVGGYESLQAYIEETASGYAHDI